MTQYDFDKLLEKYMAGNCSPNEEKQIIDWADRMLGKETQLLKPTKKVVLERRIWARIAANTVAPARTVSRRTWAIFSMAASVALAVLVGLYQNYIPTPGSLVSSIKGVVEVTNTYEKPQHIRLQDGSLVVLKEGSSISYPEHFGVKNRLVILKGEAFFQVKRDKSKPFIVNCSGLMTEVLGTSFTIRAFDNAPSVEVKVKTGLVSVYEEKANDSSVHGDGVLLTRNQQVTFEKKTKKLIPALVDNPSLLPAKGTKQAFIFDGTPITEVLQILGDLYGVAIILENDRLNKCVFTGDLSELPLYTQLDFICKSVNATYERRGTSLFINGEGCQ